MKLVFALFATAVAAMGRGRKQLPPPLKLDDNASLMNAGVKNGTFTFDQLIDHGNPDAGTFSQRIWYNAEFWAGPGSPVVFFTPGEIAADGYTAYLTNATLSGALAQEIGGAVVMLEHRYWGESSPFAVLDNKNLQYLTLNQSILDNTYFAQNVKFPFDKDQSSCAPDAPWVFIGGSYSGALSAWTEATQPGTFWAYHSSSAPVQAVYDMWTYFAPIEEGMPKNCSKDIGIVLNYMDKVLTGGDDQMKTKLKTLFGAQDIKYDDDFMSALMFSVQSWQGNSFTTGYSPFFQLCDAVEGVFGSNHTGPVPGEEGVGLRTAINGWANFMRTQYFPGYCAGTYPKYYSDNSDLSCFNTHDPNSKLFTDREVDNEIDRQWFWFLCNEPFAYWQNSQPEDADVDWRLVSSLVTPEYNQRQCELFFPKEGNWTYGSAEGLTVDDVNKWTHGWDDRKATRLLYVNGEFDPWKSDSVSSNFRPGGPMQSTEEQPILMLPGAFHCSDLRLSNAQANEGIMKVVQQELEILKGWVGEFKSQGGNNQHKPEKPHQTHHGE